VSCPSIEGLVLDAQSLRAIEQIRSKGELAQFIGGTASFGVLVNIFSTRQPAITSYNIYQTDFQLFAKAMSGIPDMYRRSVMQVAGQQELRSLDYKQRNFWKAVRQGCNL
jgi:hypothetical protein